MAFQKNNTAKAKPLPPGVYTPSITIYQDTPEQAVDHEAQYKHFQSIAASGMHGIVALGTNGEMTMLNHAERAEVIRTARKAVVDLGIPDYPIVAGIAAQSTSETVQFAKEAAEAGAGWGLLLPPSYWTKAVSADVVAAFYTDVADQSPIPIVIYNVCWSSEDRTRGIRSFANNDRFSTLESCRAWMSTLTPFYNWPNTPILLPSS